ncbi:uncharacterized protein BXIN_1568 [Babesia sp. Xinjiang]|uniref:uncharacterized protein n=1 Tax=Babesia sp. Xinjiang TaxID=462227 RepID=UPI000A242014|nr:uncharacterized protein BXIN_1568 [Babesia sp. Xinjiang]ORM42327.1 hypothetical protein BXIN_1568 [Babesia sp. Xinjiang]
MKTPFWFFALIALLWPVQCRKKSPYFEGLTIDELYVDGRAPVNMANPAPTEVPKYLKAPLSRFPSTLVDTLMRSYCEKKEGAFSQYACNNNNACKCYTPKNISQDSILWQNGKDSRSHHLLLGVPYNIRSTIIGFNFVSQLAFGKCLDRRYKPLQFEIHSNSVVLDSEVVKTVDTYKDSFVRGQKTLKVQDAINFFTKDPLCTLGSNLYYREGWDIEQCATGSSSYRRMHEKRAVTNSGVKQMEEKSIVTPGDLQVNDSDSGDEDNVDEDEGENENEIKIEDERPTTTGAPSLIQSTVYLPDQKLEYWDTAVDSNSAAVAIVDKYDNRTTFTDVVVDVPKSEQPQIRFLSPVPDETVPQSEINDPLRFCSSWDIFRERHHIDLTHSACGPVASRQCDDTKKGRFCRPVVQNRFYIPIHRRFRLPIEHFTFSTTFAVYLGPENLRCGSYQSFTKGIHYIKTPELKGVPILEEVIKDDRRFFRVGQFRPSRSPVKYNICMCSSHDADDDVKTCLQFSEYTNLIGQVVFTPPPKYETANVQIGTHTVATSNTGIPLLVDSASNFGSCSALFDLFSIDWSIPSVERMPNHGAHITVLQRAENGSIKLEFKRPGLYYLCFVDEVTAEVREHNVIYLVAGVRDNVKAVLHRNTSGELVGHSVVFQHYDNGVSKLDSIFVVKSATDCNAPTIGHWSGGIFPYYAHKLQHMKMWVARDLKLSLDKAEELPRYAVCVQYVNNSDKFLVGTARVEDYFHENEEYLLGTPFLVKEDPVDVSNYVLRKGSNEITTFFSLLSSRIALAKKTNPKLVDNTEYYHAIFHGADQVVIHSRTYESSSIVTFWAIIDDDPTLYPLTVMKFRVPIAVRVGLLTDTFFVYVLDSSGNLARVPFGRLIHPMVDDKNLFVRKITKPRYMDLWYSGSLLLIGVVDTHDKCFYLYDGQLEHQHSLCNSQDHSFIDPGRISCVNTEVSGGTSSCFVALPMLNEVAWLDIHVNPLRLGYVDRYKQGSSLYDFNSVGGSPASVFAMQYKNDAMVFVVNESGEHGFLLHADRSHGRLSYMYPLTNVARGCLLRGISPILVNTTNSRAMLLCESYPSSLLDPSLNVEGVLESSRALQSSRWGFMRMMIDDLVQVPSLTYELDPWFIIGNSYDVHPTPHGRVNRRFPHEQYRLEPKDGVAPDLHKNYVSVNNEGKLHIQSPVVLTATYDVVRSNMWLSDRTTVVINISCPDGKYFDGSTCQLCPVGTYNSFKYSINNPEFLHRCKPCAPTESTMSVGSASEDDCTCMAGHTLLEEPRGDLRCRPCSGSTYKSKLGFDKCIGTCGPNAYSTATGSLSHVDMFCRCFPGFYFIRTRENASGVCKPCEEGYYCLGGYKSKQQKCPIFTTTLAQAASSINDCVCLAGYQPADVDRILQEGTYEHDLAQKILSTHKLKDYHRWVCVPCPNNKYKDRPSSQPCSLCPNNTYSWSSGNDSVEKCNRCAPGYFETGDSLNPCEACPPNHICVGSDPVDSELKVYSGKRIKCHKNAITIPPYEKNTALNLCLCDKGYMSRTRYGIVKCEAVPKNTYKDIIGNVGAKECPHGSYTLLTGAISVSECVCSKGMYFDETNKHCTICPLGRYCLGGRLPNGEHMPPTLCSDGNAVTKEPGASSASECLCKPGYYMRQDGLGGCIECPENTYKSHASNESCTPCEKNSMTYGVIGATSESQCVCSPGYFLDGTCKACGSPDQYCPGSHMVRLDDLTGKAVYETQAPVECPPNTEIPPGVDTADSVDSCKCAIGFALAKREEGVTEKICIPCAPGSYKSSVMDSSCHGLCTQNATSKPGAHSPSQCYCQKGYYYLSGGICAPCVEGARCDGGLIEKGDSGYSNDALATYDDHVKPVPIVGYYLDKINQELRRPDDWRFILCPVKGACLGEEGCSESMTAYLCAECKKGYTSNFRKGTLCTKCPPTLSNLLLTIAWYLGLLLVNIVIACLNVSAGYNRRSIHSVVIKIALNYGICMSVLNVVNFADFPLPEELKSVTRRWFKLLYRGNQTFYTSIDCLLQDWFGLGHADSFFYSMLFIACLPVILLVVVTVLMWVILELFKIKRHSTTRSKLALLYQSSVQGMHYLSDRLRDEYSNERLFLIFRYIPLPGETNWVRFKHFLEDMIPIYVTVLFSVHGNTTSQMLSLLDCTCIHLGQSIPSKYVLRPAMSIKCSLDPSKGYIPYLLLGLGGLIFWGFGIPFFSYIVLLMNRKNLYAPDVRMKYGFLHNGYQQDYWFWEAIVFTRKSLVLVIGSIVIVPSENTSASRIWMALAVAVVFLIIQLIYKPFDERDYFVLGRLESHSMISWTANLLVVSLMCYVTMTPFVVTLACACLLINSGYFLYVLVTSLVRSLIEKLKYKRHNRFFRKISWLVEALLLFDSRRNLREPVISYNQRTSQLQVRLPRHRYTWFGKKSAALKHLERYYFVNVVTELYRIVVRHLKLDVMPKSLIEFLVRLSLSFTRFEEKMGKRELFQELSQGDLSTLVAWATDKESRKLHKIVKLDSMEGGQTLANMVVDDQNLSAAIGLRHEELQFIMDCLFDDKVLESNTTLSDFYHSLTRIWIMDTDMLTFLFSVFKHVKAQRSKESIDGIVVANEKLRKTEMMLQSVVDDDDDGDAFTAHKSIADMETHLEKLLGEKDRLNTHLKNMRDNPDLYVPEDEEGKDTSMDSLMMDLGFSVKNALERAMSDESSSEYDTETDSDASSDESEDTSDDESDD